jgi:hypothetical protein
MAGLTTAQLISVAIVVIGAILVWTGWNRRDPAYVGA